MVLAFGVLGYRFISDHNWIDDLRKKTGCTIIGYIAPDGNYIINPEADLKMQPKSKVIVLGRPEQVKKLNQMLNIE